ncbi:hypothetical protein [Polynucleobacter sp. 71A-WALBACH]|nr:hypothetical protein [Polynucleobacter sp. 71A-WALBACH]
MKWFFTIALACFISPSFAQENSNPFDVQVSVIPIEGRLQIQAS